MSTHRYRWFGRLPIHSAGCQILSLIAIAVIYIFKIRILRWRLVEHRRANRNPSDIINGLRDMRVHAANNQCSR